MVTSLWLLSLFFLANILIALAFLTYSWIYADAFRSQKNTKDAFRAVGGVLLSLYFILSILNFNSALGNITLFMLLLLSSGLFSIFYGNLLEPIPGIPENSLNSRKLTPVNYFALIIFISIGIGLSFLNTIPEYSKIVIILNFTLFCIILAYILVFRKSYLQPNSDLRNEEAYRKHRNTSMALIIIPFFTAPLLSILIAVQNFKKVFEGLSREFKLLAIFWSFFSGFTLIQLLSAIGQYYFVFIDVFTRQYSILWITNQVLLIICAILMFRWISQFISFRVVARIFLYIWQISIVLTVVLASTYSIFVISSSESQVTTLLTKNANLIQFNMEQIKSNNNDMLKLLGENEKLATAIINNDVPAIQTEVGTFINNNSFLDKVQVISNTAILIYDSGNPTEEGTNLSDNPIISQTTFLRTAQSGFVSEKNGIDSLNLNYQFTYPLIEANGKLDGIITSIKGLNDNYLDLLKKQTDQELIVYVNGKRSASTILQDDNLSRLENLPLAIDTPLSTGTDVNFYKGRILTTPYYLAIVNLKDVQGNILANLVIGTKQSLLINITENSLYQLFLLSLVITLLSTVPSYFLAKNLRKDISA